ncbi:MAG: AMP phosphorylase [Promethearchaeota archaeon]
MKLKVKDMNVCSGAAGTRIVIVNEADAVTLGIKAGDHVEVQTDAEVHTVAIVDVTSSDSFVAPGEILPYKEVLERLQGGSGDPAVVTVRPAERPPSLKAVRRKMKGRTLSEAEIEGIVSDATRGVLSKVELAGFLTSLEINGLNEDEIVALTRAMANSGLSVKFAPPVYEKHSTGGVPGNKISLVIVPIVAAAGLRIPKTSTRAITSPSGTADTMECLAPIEHDPETLKEILRDVGGFVAHGGGLNVAPADGIFIEVERVLNIDPKGLIVASILAKKLAMSVQRLVLDVPCGPGTKFPTPEAGEQFAHLFKRVAAKVGVEAECALTLANQPVGHAVGPALEAREALRLLGNWSAGPTSLIEKSTTLAGILLEMGGVVPKGRGQERAKEILRSGAALEKMRQIVEAQGGDPEVTPADLPVGRHVHEVFSTKEGYVTDVDNAQINEVAKAAGCPTRKGAGLVLHRKIGAFVREGDKLMDVYAESESYLSRAITKLNQRNPVILGGMLIKRV